MAFPKDLHDKADQDEVYFHLEVDGDLRSIRFHDYDTIYSLPGLYEQLFYERLKCCSPEKVASILHAAVSQSRDSFTELRVLDLGAGNGMMGEALCAYGVSRVVGIDILPEARDAALRDRAGLYDAYHVEDLTELSDERREEFEAWKFDCMVTVAALGFGDIPVKAFIEAFNLTVDQAWIAFNIKESFLGKYDETGFSRMIRELIFSQYLDVYYIERYRHRLSIEGKPLYYFAIAGRKNMDVPVGYIESKGIAI